MNAAIIKPTNCPRPEMNGNRCADRDGTLCPLFLGLSVTEKKGRLQRQARIECKKENKG